MLTGSSQRTISYHRHENGPYAVAIETLFIEGAADRLVTLPESVEIKDGFTPADKWVRFIDPIVTELYTDGDPTISAPELVTSGATASWFAKGREVYCASLQPVLDLNAGTGERA